MSGPVTWNTVNQDDVLKCADDILLFWNEIETEPTPKFPSLPRRKAFSTAHMTFVDETPQVASIADVKPDESNCAFSLRSETFCLISLPGTKEREEFFTVFRANAHVNVQNGAWVVKQGPKTFLLKLRNDQLWLFEQSPARVASQSDIWGHPLLSSPVYPYGASKEERGRIQDEFTEKLLCARERARMMRLKHAASDFISVLDFIANVIHENSPAHQRHEGYCGKWRCSCPGKALKSEIAKCPRCLKDRPSSLTPACRATNSFRNVTADVEALKHPTLVEAWHKAFVDVHNLDSIRNMTTHQLLLRVSHEPVSLNPGGHHIIFSEHITIEDQQLELSVSVDTWFQACSSIVMEMRNWHDPHAHAPDLRPLGLRASSHGEGCAPLSK